MFGLLSGCGCSLGAEGRKKWNSHYCGLCIALKNGYGHLSRFTTNYDATLLSVMGEAQSEAEMDTINIICPFRRPWKIEIISPHNPFSRFGASISLMIASAKIKDHVLDKDKIFGFFPAFFYSFADRWQKYAEKSIENAGVAGFIEKQINEQKYIEMELKKDFFFYSRPTELAVACAFSHTAALAGQNSNYDLLFSMGEMYGRIMYLLDSYCDYFSDISLNKFNPLYQSSEKSEIPQMVYSIFFDSYKEIVNNLRCLKLAKPELLNILLTKKLRIKGLELIKSGYDPSYGGSPPGDNNSDPNIPDWMFPEKKKKQNTDGNQGDDYNFPDKKNNNKDRSCCDCDTCDGCCDSRGSSWCIMPDCHMNHCDHHSCSLCSSCDCCSHHDCNHCDAGHCDCGHCGGGNCDGCGDCCNSCDCGGCDCNCN